MGISVSDAARAMRRKRVRYPSTPQTAAHAAKARICAAAAVLGKAGVISSEEAERIRAEQFPAAAAKRRIAAEMGNSAV